MRLDLFVFQVFVGSSPENVEEQTPAHNYVVSAKTIEEAMAMALAADAEKFAVANEDDFELRVEVKKVAPRVVIRAERMMGRFQAVTP